MGDTQPDEHKSPTPFVRESTGLVKNVSFLDSISLNLSNMSIGGLLGGLGINLFAVGFVFVSLAGVNLIAASILGFLLSVPQIVLYTMMTRRYPRTGGDYVWVSRNLGGFFGSSISFMGYTMETTAYMALVTILAVFAIGGVGLALGHFEYLGLALPTNIGGDPNQQFAVGAALFAILVAINIFRPKFGYKLVSYLTIIGIVVLLITIGTLLSAGHSGVVNYINSLQTASGASISFDSVAASYTGSSFDWGATLFIMPVMFAFVYPWLNAAPAVASEIKGSRALKWNVPISAVVALILTTSAIATMYYVAGQPFINAMMSNSDLTFYNGINFFTLAMGVAPNSAVALVIGLGWIAWVVAILAYGIIVISRYLLSQSFDRFLPARLAYVSPKWGSPVVAHAVDLVFTITLIGLATYFYGTVSSLFGAITGSMIYFIFVGIAAMVHAMRKETGNAKWLLTAAGLGNVIVFAYVTWEFVSNYSTWGINLLSGGFNVFSLILGASLYLGARQYLRRRGLDISMAYKELPPE
ncbi:MAG: APC family permease [Thaumarchaeota archaeon]|nr:APC family permease [Nitrososphaerota archaeon]